MLNKVFNYKTVDSVLANFQRTLNDLTEIHMRANEQAVNYTAQSLELAEKAESAKAEAERASSVYNKINSLIS